MVTGTTAALTASVQRQGSSNGQDIDTVVLKNASLELHFTNIGCALMALYMPDRQGTVHNIVAGFASPNRYLDNPHYLGVIVGRCVNRIDNGRFVLDGKTIQLSVNENGNHLHGGVTGFHKKIWHTGTVQQDTDAVSIEFSYLSADGEEGYPGNLQVQVRYTLTSRNVLRMTCTAVTDKKTPVNLSSHTYYNLSGFTTPVISDHLLQVYAAAYTEKNERNLPTGRLLPVQGTPLDFSVPRSIGDSLDGFPADGGLDHNYVLGTLANVTLVPAARLYDAASGRWVQLRTNQPGLQVYTANWWDGSMTGAQGLPYVKHGAVALETQAFPDAPNHPGFPSIILEPGQTYVAVTELEMGWE